MAYGGRKTITATRDVTSTWFGVVINTVDPKKSGRVQVKIYGIHDEVPDDKCPWATVAQGGPWSAGARNIGHSPVGFIKGSTVYGTYMDHERQIPIVMGSMARAGKPKSKNSYEVDQGDEDNGENKNSTPIPSGTEKDENVHLRRNKEEHKNIVKYAEEKPQKARYAKDKTIGTLQDISGRLLSILKSIDPSNSSGTVKNAVDAMIGVQSVNGSSAGGVVSSFLRASILGALRLLIEKWEAETVITYLGRVLGGMKIDQLLPQSKMALGAAIVELAGPGGPLWPLVRDYPEALDNSLGEWSPLNAYWVEVTQNGVVLRGVISGGSFSQDNLFVVDDGTINDETRRLFQSLSTAIETRDFTSDTFAAIINSAVASSSSKALDSALGGPKASEIPNLLGPMVKGLLNDAVGKLPQTVLNQGQVAQTIRSSEEREAKARKRQQYLDTLQNNPMNQVAALLSRYTGGSARVTTRDGKEVDDG